MKKSLKMAVLLSATILAIPSAVSVVNVTRVANAATTSSTKVDNLDVVVNRVNNALTNVYDLGKEVPKLTEPDVKNGDPLITSFDFGSSNLISFKTFIESNLGKKQKSIAKDDISRLESENVQVKLFVSSIDISKSVENLQDVKSIDNKGNGYLIRVMYYRKDSTIPFTTENKNVKYSTLPEPEKDSYKELNVNYDSPVTVNLNSKLSDLMKPESTNLYVTDNEDRKLDKVSVLPGDIYLNKSDALKDNGKNVYGGVDGKFNKANKTYYQVLTVHSTNAKINDLLAHAMINDSEYSINAENIKKNEFSVVKVIYTNNTPAVDVQDNLWETKDVTGVVTTKENPFYTLTNDKNEFVKDRALTGKSAWKTNAVRTNKSGVTQYRVATNEWIDAAGITYVDGATASANTALTSTHKYDTAHVVNFDTPGTVYRLFDINGKATDRYLAGGSSWLTNERMVDANGNVFYRVSANEFVKVDNGVSFK